MNYVIESISTNLHFHQYFSASEESPQECSGSCWDLASHHDPYHPSHSNRQIRKATGNPIVWWVVKFNTNSSFNVDSLPLDSGYQNADAFLKTEKPGLLLSPLDTAQLHSYQISDTHPLSFVLPAPEVVSSYVLGWPLKKVQWIKISRMTTTTNFP